MKKPSAPSNNDFDSNFLIENAPDALLLVDPEGKILYVNTQVEHLFGYSKQELLGQMIEYLLPEAYVQKHQEHRKAYMKNPRVRPMGTGLKLYGRKKDGTQLPVEISLSPINDKEQPVILAAIRDISARINFELKIHQENDVLAQKEKEKWRLQEANRLRDYLLTNMSHELRTPLNAIIGLSELMLEEIDSSLSQTDKEYLSIIRNSSRYLLQLITDILDFSTLESGTIEFHVQPVNLVQQVNAVIKNFSNQIKENKIHLTKDLAPELSLISLDPYYFKIVLYHYLSNAIKFTPAGGKVEIRIKPENEDSFRLEVEDTGIGIDPAHTENIFLKFMQLDSGSNKKYAGLGLGLALVKKIVEAQGGRVGFSSTPNKGSIFYALLKRKGSD